MQWFLYHKTPVPGQCLNCKPLQAKRGIVELYVADWSPIYSFLYERDVTDQFSLADAVKGIVHIHDQDPALVYCFTV